MGGDWNRGHRNGGRFSVASFQLPVLSCQFSVAGFQLPVLSFRFSVFGGQWAVGEILNHGRHGRHGNGFQLVVGGGWWICGE